MGDGGGCHPRDNIALSFIARKYRISYDWWEGLMLSREKQTEWLADMIEEYWYEHSFNLERIVIMGKTFKPETNLTYGSPSILLYNILCEKIDKELIEMFDPYVDDHKEGQSEEWGACLFFIGTKHPFQNLPWGKGSIVIDPWRYIPDQEGVKVIRIGEGK
jgi:UDPglucose 6-dehydrogenase